MIEIRSFNELGISKFESYLSQLDNSTEYIKPDLNLDLYSTILESRKPVFLDENKKFKTRMDLGNYLNHRFRLAGIKRETIIIENPEEWNNVFSWIAYIWLEQLVPKTRGTIRTPALSRFIVSNDWNRYYRHYIAAPYYIHSLLGEEKSLLFLDCPPSIHNEFMEQIASRQWIITSQSLVDLAHHLYWDFTRKTPKRGARGKKAGTVRRFGKVINQFRLTHDIQMMNMDQMLKLLPNEFNEWK